MISIIIPTLNEESILEETLKNIRMITRFPIELIVSDGKSTDRTIEIAKKYADKVVVHEGEKRQTIGMGRNLGAVSATGKYLLYLDSDVLMLDPNALVEKVLGEFEHDENLVGATVRLQVRKEMATFWDNFFYTIVDRLHYLSNNIFHTGSSSGEFQFIRRMAFDKIGGYDETMACSEDNDMFMRLAKVGRTKIFYDLTIYQTGRRVHKIGWPKMWATWTINMIYLKLFHKAYSKEWTVIR